MSNKDFIIPEGLVEVIDGVSYIRHDAYFEKEIKPLILAPFNDGLIPVVCRVLSFPEIRECGDFSLIETFTDRRMKERTPRPAEILSYSEMQYSIVKAALVSPTYDEIMALSEGDELRKKSMIELEEISSLIETLPNGPKKQKLEMSRDTIKMQTMYILPPGFVSVIMAFALRMNSTDIKKVSEDMLFEAYLQAKEFGGAPSQYIPGNFTDFNEADINKRSLLEGYKRKKENK